MSPTRSIPVLGGEGDVELPADLFGVQTNVPLIHQVVVAQLAAARQGTHSTKTRGEVSGGGAKPWRQKGTGRARQGSRRAPQWVGGGTVHGPQPRSYAQRTPKKMVAQALFGSLSDRAREGRIHVVEQILDGETPSTKTALKALAEIGGAKVLVVLSRDEDVAWMSLRNVPSVHVIVVDQLNAYDVLVADDVVFTTKALAEFVARKPVGHVVADEPGDEAAESKPAVAETDQAEEKAAGAAEDKAGEESETEAETGDSEFGEGSYVGDNPPEGYTIKGNASSKKYHTPESPYYSRTKAEVWFESVEAAEKAGFVAGAHPHGTEEHATDEKEATE